jgi:hypothetical protein
VDRLVTIALALASFFAKIGFALGKQQGRAEFTEEQRRLAMAYLADFEAIAGDNRTLDDALAKLRGVRDQPGASRRDVP